LEDYLQPRPQNNERHVLDRLVEVLERSRCRPIAAPK